MRLPAERGADRQHELRRRLLWLVLAVLVVDALFVAGFYLLRLPHAPEHARIAYTAAWTAVTLGVVLRALARIRSVRGRRP